MKLIVTAGGQGKKVWPLSREAKPKQFQPIVGNTALYQQTIETLLKSYQASDIFISTKKRYFDIAKSQSPQIPLENYILEPDVAKDRGPGEGLAFLTLSERHPDEPFMIIQSDVLRFPEDKFLDMIAKAEKIQVRDRKYMSGGIKANYPILGVDYLSLGDDVPSDDGLEVFVVDEFIPRNNDYHKTKKLVENYHIATHSNHSCWYPDLMLKAYDTHRPDWYQSLMQIRDLHTKGASEAEIEAVYSQMEAGPTELVTTNLFKGAYAILLPFKWTDIGTWDSIYEFSDSRGEVFADGNALVESSKSSLIKSDNPQKLIAAYGIENLVIIDTKDVLLVIPKDKTNNVGDIVKLLKEKGLDQYL